MRWGSLEYFSWPLPLDIRLFKYSDHVIPMYIQCLRIFKCKKDSLILSTDSQFLCNIIQGLLPILSNGKTIALTRQTFFDKVISLLLNMPSRLVTTFLPRSKHFLISWLQGNWNSERFSNELKVTGQGSTRAMIWTHKIWFLSQCFLLLH